MTMADGFDEMPDRLVRPPHPNFLLTNSPTLQQTLTEMGLPTHLVGFPLPYVLETEAVGALNNQAVLVSTDPDDATIWFRATELRADFVCILPDGDAWLRDQIAGD